MVDIGHLFYCRIWLERKFVNITLQEEDIGINDDIQEVEALLKDDKNEEERND